MDFYFLCLREALLNNGAAIVFFIFFKNIAGDNGLSILEAFGNLAHNLIVSPIIGIPPPFSNFFLNLRNYNQLPWRIMDQKNSG